MGKEDGGYKKENREGDGGGNAFFVPFFEEDVRPLSTGNGAGQNENCRARLAVGEEKKCPVPTMQNGAFGSQREL
jgi:hypothetical protein